jgi:hypothetical protein
MPALTLLAGAVLTSAALLFPAVPSCPPPDDAPYTAMDDYVRSLEFWHRHPDWGFSTPPQPRCWPNSPAEPC